MQLIQSRYENKVRILKNVVPMRSKRRRMGLSHGNNTAALPPMLLGDFETAQRAQNAVMASYAFGFALAARRQPHPP